MMESCTSLYRRTREERLARTLCLRNGFAVRTITTHTFDDDECLEVLGIWRPFQHHSKTYEEEINSTNTSLLNSDEKGGGFFTSRPANSRPWDAEDVHGRMKTWPLQDLGSSTSAQPLPNPGLLQLQGGLALYEAIAALSQNLRDRRC